jgi:competence protein ComEC
MPQPILVLLAGTCTGIVWLQAFATLPSDAVRVALAAAGGIAVGWALHRPRSRCPAALLPLAIVACGAIACGLAYAATRAQWRLADELPSRWEGESLQIVGVVDDLPQNTPQGTHFAFAVEQILTRDAVVPSRVSIGWFAGRDDDRDIPQVHAGERWRLVVRLRRPHGYVNPAGFDLEAWLLEHELRATGYVRADMDPQRIDAFAGRPGDYVQRAREQVRTRIVAALPGAPYAGVLVALAIGDQRAIPDGLQQSKFEMAFSLSYL